MDNKSPLVRLGEAIDNGTYGKNHVDVIVMDTLCYNIIMNMIPKYQMTNKIFEEYYI